MRAFLTLGLILFSASVCWGQLVDNFSDGDYTSNPTWTPDIASNWIVISNRLRSNSTTANTIFSISTPSTQTLNAQWEFYVNLQFNTSSANFADVFLTSSNATMTSSNGYFVRIGGTPDEISLYKSSAGVNSILINGTDGVTNTSNNTLKIKVTRDAFNLWKLERDNTGTGNTYVSEGTANDNSFTTSSFFGIRITQSTVGFFQKHSFGNIYVGNIILDNSPPILNSSTVASSTELNLLFNESLDPISSQLISNYNANNGLGNPTTAVLQPDQKTVNLIFSQAFPNGIQNQLTLSGIKDLFGNAMSSMNQIFLFFQAFPTKNKDLIISEIFADPSPQVGMPDVEFIEIYNRSNNPIDLNGWKLSDGTSTAVLPTQIILPNEYWIITSSASISKFTSFGKIVGVANFPTLNNDGDVLTLKTSITIDSVAYSSSWYQNIDKASGGWSLELIDPNNTCLEGNNWTASTDSKGGTPGKQNSVFANKPDVTGPRLLTATIVNPSQLLLVFDEKSEPNLGSVLATITPPVPVSKINFNNPSLTEIKIDLGQALEPGKLYTIQVGNLHDCTGNLIQEGFNKLNFVIPLPSKNKDLIITEIFADPSPQIGMPDAEFIEIYNRSNNPIDLNGWKLSDGSSTAVLPTQIILPNEYWIITSSASVSKFTSFGKVVGAANFPTLNNDGESLTLKTSIIIDSVAYSSAWYQDEDKANGGWSLELIDPANVCGEGNNWVSSTDSKGGTPGKQNSIFANKPDVTGPKLLTATPFSPNELILTFDEKLEKPLGLVSIVITPFSTISKGYLSNQALTEIKVELLQPLELRHLYKIEISNLRDCAGNFIQGEFNHLDFALPEKADSLDIIINEILFNPYPNGVDFVEVYNRSEKFINLKNFKLANIENKIVKNTKTIAPDLILSPSSYLVFTSDPEALKLQYSFGGQKNFLKTDLPSLNDDEGSFAFANDKNITLDYFLYSDKLHSPLIKDKEGVSLERISFIQDSNEPSNWKSASSVSGFATPGYLNSNSRPESFINENAVTIEPEIFALNEPGQDFSKINYRFDQNSFVANVKIVDQQGRLIKTIANNKTLGLEGSLRWDGDQEDGSKARLGYYQVWFEVFDNSGTVITFRKRVVIVSRN